MIGGFITCTEELQAQRSRLSRAQLQRDPVHQQKVMLLVLLEGEKRCCYNQNNAVLGLTRRGATVGAGEVLRQALPHLLQHKVQGKGLWQLSRGWGLLYLRSWWPP